MRRLGDNPAARSKKSMSPQLRTLGATMNRRGLQLIAKRPMEIAVNQARAFPLAALSLGAVGLWAITALARRRRPAKTVLQATQRRR